MLGKEIKAIFDSILSLPPGNIIEIKCADHAEASSIRTRMYRERDKLSDRTGTSAESIKISRVFKDDAYHILISRAEDIAPRIKLINTEQEERPFIIKRRTGASIQSSEDRIQALKEEQHETDIDEL